MELKTRSSVIPTSGEYQKADNAYAGFWQHSFDVYTFLCFIYS